MLAARRDGVEQPVLARLADTLPHPDWPGLARHVMSRALIDGRRRAAEVREVTRTVEESDLRALQRPATAERQDWAADLGLALPPEVLATREVTTLMDAVLAAAATA
jgi:3-hydroxyisobutyrate dehydrogenase